MTCRDNLVIEQPYSNGIWYDVGNRDGVFVNNWVEGALGGFFFEISRGATVAGNVFVRRRRWGPVADRVTLHFRFSQRWKTIPEGAWASWPLGLRDGDEDHPTKLVSGMRAHGPAVATLRAVNARILSLRRSTSARFAVL